MLKESNELRKKKKEITATCGLFYHLVTKTLKKILSNLGSVKQLFLVHPATSVTVKSVDLITLIQKKNKLIHTNLTRYNSYANLQWFC